ncbi:MAG TPA: metallophosphoesterase family protein [Arenibaculum sp.]|nr:metallophosphoesterase family protein [Arenibaculum sp.]
MTPPMAPDAPAIPEIDLSGADRLLVFGGAYGNLHAVGALLAEAGRLGIGPDAMICTGDTVAYCADPAETVETLRRAGMPHIKGNCEDALALRSPDCGCGFEEGTACSLLSQHWFRYADAHVDDDQRHWMASLPDLLAVRFAGRRLIVAHGTPRRMNQFVFASTPWPEKRAELDAVSADGILAGHCGLPFTQIAEGRLWHNAGAIGMPANDGRPGTWYSLLSAVRDGIEIEHRQLAYDHRAASARMAEAKLLPDYAATLRTGLWPSLDVLPPDERERTGQPLAPARHLWRAAGRPAAS